MECAECRTSNAALTRVEYEVGETETIPLCATCRDEFREGALVEEVSLIDQ